MNKGIVEEKIAKIRAKYSNNPKIAERKISQFLAKDKERVERLQQQAQRKLEAISPSRVAKTPEQIDAAAEALSNPTAKSVLDAGKNAGKAVVNGGKSVISGVSKVYTGTGKVLTEGGALVYKHPLAGPGWLSGDAVNIVGSSLGHPEVLSVPVGTIVGGTGLAIERAVLPRATQRRFRQNSIRLRKKAAASGFSEWSLQKAAQESHPYRSLMGTAGYIG